MQPLINQLHNQGLSDEQIQSLFLTIHEWLEDHYPMIAQISKPIMVHDLGIKEISLSNYVLIGREVA